MKTRSVIIGFLMVLGSTLSAQVPDTLKYRSLDPYYFHLNYLKDTKAVLIDVREFFEYKKARLKGAVNIPSSGNLAAVADTLNKDASLFLYCTSGFRSKRVAKFFYDKGITALYSLEGGIVEWKKEGMPVDKKRIRKRH